MTRHDVLCPVCGEVREVRCPVGESVQAQCSTCGTEMKTYYGRRGDLAINYGFRPHRYGNETDRNIAQFQFTHL